MIKLRKILIGKIRETGRGKTSEPILYGVEGLPEGQTAKLTKDKWGWIFVRKINGQEHQSSQAFTTADEALAVLEQDVINESGSTEGVTSN